MRRTTIVATALLTIASADAPDGIMTELCRITDGPFAASFIVGNDPDKPFPDGWLVSARDDWDFGDGNVWREVTPRHPDGPLTDDETFWLPAAMVSCGDDIAGDERVGENDCDAGQTFFDWPVPVFPAPDQPAKGAVMGGTELVYLDKQTAGGTVWAKFSAPADGNDVGWISVKRLDCAVADTEPPPQPDAAPSTPETPATTQP